MKKTELLEQAAQRFPSGCSYIHAGGSSVHKNVHGQPYFWGDDRIALASGCGLIYDNGEWAIRIDKDGKVIPFVDEQNINYEVY